MISIGTALKLGAAVLVGAVVFIGSTVGQRESKKKKNQEQQQPQGCQQQPVMMGSATTVVGGGPGYYGQPMTALGSTSNGLQEVQSVMMKTSQFITTLITVCDAVNRLFSPEPAYAMPRYSTSSTMIL